ncbi:MAG: glycerol-3-phosphate 1-O-acyltransferase PlsY [Caldimicrobium sp.]|nr:glycerol-3-phosphate 1-O-acyltransferase PlsY [Caldimicrobium sp.]MCX7613327.1 glycerol-3-phosphate 1-O-acyltransferase PlsY [Caldimicrobium sp.]MDW8183392.1 glycerol-3-phosphate 1-O-acyltransferase PlsY [Caldimicrobium sp.]
MAFEYLFYFLTSYILGSIPFALIVSLPQGVDPRKEGSKNPGATNVTRLLGKKWGFITFLGDSGKGVIALLLVKIISSQSFTENPKLYAGVAFFAVTGHLFSIFLKFHGGKGVATTVGTFLVLTPKALIGTILVFFPIVYFSGFVSLGSIIAVISLTLFILIFKYPIEYFFSSLILAILIIFKHKENIKRLLKGEEKTWRKVTS